MAFISKLPFKYQKPSTLKFIFSNCTGANSFGQNVHSITGRITCISPYLTHRGYNIICSKAVHQRFSNICEYSQSTLPKAHIQLSSLKGSFSNNFDKNIRLFPKLYSTNTTDEPNKLTKKEQFKKAVKEYGATVIVFHVAISMFSLGGCYVAVTSGLNLQSYLPTNCDGSGEIATEAGMFVVAYAVHKVLAPVRITITLFSVPFIVRYLKRINVLKR